MKNAYTAFEYSFRIKGIVNHYTISFHILSYEYQNNDKIIENPSLFVIAACGVTSAAAAGKREATLSIRTEILCCERRMDPSLTSLVSGRR